MSIPNGQVVTIYDQYVAMNIDGIAKILSIDDFKTVLDKILNTEAKIDPIILPRNVMMFGKSTTNIQLNTYWPGIEAELTMKEYGVNAVKKFKVKMPNVIMYYSLTINNVGTFTVQSAKYFSTPKLPGELGMGLSNLDFIRDYNYKEKIYPLALPNMYSDCRACYGSNTMPGGLKSDLRSLDWYYLFLRETPFNTDLSVPGVQRQYQNAKALLEYLQSVNKEEYPFDQLYGK